MIRNLHVKGIVVLVFLVTVLVAPSQLASGSLAAPADQGSAEGTWLDNGGLQPPLVQAPTGNAVITTAADCIEDTDCPTPPSGLDKCVERPKFCVYYTTDSISEGEAEWAADTVQDYWDRFVALGFGEPKYSTKLRVDLSDIPGDCNGGTSWSSNAISTYAGCFDVTLLAQKVLGHELTHRLQYAHDTSPGAPIQTKFLKEGTARSTEDNWFTEIDHWAAALSHSSFNSEVNNYLAAPNNDITSIGMRYKSCLWWKYAMEQYGTTTTEPERGIDFVSQVFDKNTLGYSGISAVNQVLASKGTTFDHSFKQFAAANWAKDLNGVSSTYDYDDEDEVGNPGPYGPIVPASGGTISVGVPASWTNQYVARYGLRYYSANVDSNCPVVSASFDRDDSGPAFYHLITQNGSDQNTHVQGSGADWSQAFLNDGITQVTAILGSLGNSSQVDITLECVDPDLEIKMPNSVAVARVQNGTKFLAQVQVTGDSVPVVAGLSNTDFVATVGGEDAPVTGGGFIQEQYWLLIQAPIQPDGTYDLVVALTGTSASDTSPASVVYTEDLVDQVLVIDRSGSMGMGSPTRLSAAKDAASFYVDVTRDDDGLAVVPFNADVDPPPFVMAAVDSTVRTDAKAYINALTDGGMTSIGDGLEGALIQLAISPTENPLCSFVLLSDGMENSYKFWTDVQGDVIASGCPVTTIAFGPESDETLMQAIAVATGGLYFYNDVYVSSSSISPAAAVTPADMFLDLGNTYEYAEGKAEGRQRLLAEKGTLSDKNPEATYTVMVDETISDTVFALNWYAIYGTELALELEDDVGNTYDESYPGYFKDTTNNHAGFRIPAPEQGLWQVKVFRKVIGDDGSVPYQVLVSGKSYLTTLELLLPDRLGVQYYTGEIVPLYAILSTPEPVESVVVSGTVTSRDGSITLVPFYDDGEHGDGKINDGLYAGYFTAVNQAEAVEPSEEEDQSEPKDEGSYRVLVRATHEKFQREALGAFSVLDLDEDGNRLPDGFERTYGVSDPVGDPDLDGLTNYGEYMNGTDPTNPDTDGGGEKDGSEVNGLRDPLDPGDDAIPKPDFFQVSPLNAGVLLQFGTNTAYSKLRYYRSTNPDGPWGEGFLIDPTGHFTDTNQVENGNTYFYRMEAVSLPAIQDNQPNAPEEITSAVLSSEAVTPSEDPLPPEALVIINGGAVQTSDLNVILSFVPYESEGYDASETFEDITEMKLSNEPSFAEAEWQPFKQDVEWVLDAELGEIATVYARFRDISDNETVGTEMDMILYDNWRVYLPISFK